MQLSLTNNVLQEATKQKSNSSGVLPFKQHRDPQKTTETN